MTVSLGTNPIAWSNDDMRELGGETPLETCLAEARAAGYEGIEMGHKFPRQAGPLREVLKAHGLRLVSGWYSSALLERSAAEEIVAIGDHLELLEALGCSVLIFAETSNAIHGDSSMPISASPRLPAAGMVEFGRRVSEVADFVAGRGLKLAYHHHMGTIVETADEIDAFMEATDDMVGLLLDTGHAAFAGADPLALAKAYCARISHFHAKDLRADVRERARRDDLSFLDAVVAGVFTVPGDGNVDFPPVFEVLGGAGYEGWLVVEAEQDPAKADPRTYAELGHGNLSRMAAAANLL